MDSAAAELDEEERVQPLQHDGLDRKEVDREHAMRLHAQELTPRKAGALSSWPQTGSLKDLAHGGDGYRGAKAAQLTDDPLVAPTPVLAREAHHQRPSLAVDRRLAR
jgi:hypothetical protein